MKPLEPPNSHYLRAAVGWLELGNGPAAFDELENIAPALRAHPSVLRVRYDIYAKAEKWGYAADLASALTDLMPKEPEFWILHAYATRRAEDGGVPKAKDILLRAHEAFPIEATILYNLACYECVLGNLESAREWLGKAFSAGEPTKLKLMALDDPDLRPLLIEEKS